MRLNLFRTKDNEKIDIYYSSMTPMIEQIIGIVRGEPPLIYGTIEGEKVLLKFDEILYFDTVDRRNYAYTSKETYQISQNLSSLEEELDGYGFVRISKANLVNIYQIKKIRPEPNMRVRILLDNGEYLQINRAYKKSFEEYLIRYRNAK